MARLVQPQELSDVWPECEPWIAAAIACGQGDENALDVLIALARGQYLLWHERGKFAAVVQVQKFPRQTVAQILYCGGTGLQEMQAAVEAGREWCKANGISQLRVWGRKGWEKVFNMTRKGVILQTAV